MTTARERESLQESDIHARRRAKLMQGCPDGLILVRGEGAAGANPHFRYLTGLDAATGALLLAPGGMRLGTGRAHPGPDYVRGRIVQQVLFLPRPDALAARWGEQGGATLDRVSAEQGGVDLVRAADELPALLAQVLPGAGLLHYVRGFPATLAGEDDPDTRFVDRLRRRFFGLRVADATPAVSAERRVKDAVELRAIERAAEITGLAVDRVFATTRPGMREHEVEACVAQVFRSHGAGFAFETIVACGANAVLPHYRANSGPVRAGELLLVDLGATWDGYRADVTRTFPVDGRFRARQREVYEVVLEAQKRAIEGCRPGASLGDVHALAFEVVDAAGFGPYFIHGTSHFIGLETHDVGDVHAGLEPGAVLTVEPGIYIAEEAIGVRIEDDVLVTDGAPRVLTRAIPSSVEALEAVLARRGD